MNVGFLIQKKGLKLRVGVSIGLDMVSIEISISTSKKSQSRPSRKSRRFSKVSLDDRDKVSISLDWSRPSRPPGLFKTLCCKNVGFLIMKTLLVGVYFNYWSFHCSCFFKLPNLTDTKKLTFRKKCSWMFYLFLFS